MISVIIPSRGRPESLLRAVSACARGSVEVIVGLDADDPTTPWARDLLARSVPAARVIVSPRHESLPHLQNFLAAQADGDFILPLSDDYEVVHEDWVARVAERTAELPDGLGIVYLNDPVYPGFTTFPVIPRKLYAMQGFLMAPFFPFLFTDTWWDEVGYLSGMKLACTAEIRLLPETGHEHHYRDFALWAELFDLTRPLRAELAIAMLAAIRHRLEPGFYERAVGSIPDRAARCAAFHASWTRPADVVRLEAMGSYPDSERYRAIKAKAEKAVAGFKALKVAA